MGNPLSALFESLSGLFAKKGGSVLGIDIGSSAIKVVQLRRERGTAVLETYGAIALGPYAGLEIGRATNLGADKLAEALKDVLREANTTTRDCAISIPYAASLISLIKVPEVPEKQLASLVPIEARKYIPVPIGEVALDWFVVPHEGMASQEKGPRKLDVLLVAIHKDTIAKYQTIVNMTGLSAGFFEIEVFSTVRASLDHGLAPVAVLDMGAGSAKLYIVERGIVKESHLINKGSQDVTLSISRALNIPVAKAEEMKRAGGILPEAQGTVREASELALNYILSEVQRSLLSFEQRTNTAIAGLFATAGGATLKGFKEFAEKKIETTLTLGDPFSKTDTPAFLAPVLKEAGPQFSVAVGLALRKLQEQG